MNALADFVVKTFLVVVLIISGIFTVGAGMCALTALGSISNPFAWMGLGILAVVGGIGFVIARACVRKLNSMNSETSNTPTGQDNDKSSETS